MPHAQPGAVRERPGPAEAPRLPLTLIGQDRLNGVSSVVAGAGACLMSSSPGRPAQPVAEVIDRAGDQGREQMLQLVAGQRDQPAGGGRQLRSVTAATTRKAWASMARVTHRYQERQRRTWCWSRRKGPCRSGSALPPSTLLAYLDDLPVGQLAELPGELPSSRQQPLGLGVLLVALNERLPDAYKLLLPAGQPGPGEGRRRSLHQVVADRRAARASRHPDAPASGLAEWLVDRQQQADLHADRARRGAVAERRVAEAPRAQATDPTRPPAARSPATHQPTGTATGRTRTATASPRTTSATVWRTTGCSPITSARATVGRCPSRRRAPRTGCRWAATTTRSTTSRGPVAPLQGGGARQRP
jgi:hypothetical protein